MTTETTNGTGSMGSDAERRMRRWLRTERYRERIDHHPEAEMPAQLGPYLTLSRETGTGAAEIAHLVGEQLGWDVLDREMLDSLAEQYHLPRNILDVVDETRASWLHEAFNKLMNPDTISQSLYLKRLGHVLVAAASHGHVIVVGRGAQFLLPPESGFSVRLVASEKYRIDRLAQVEGISHEAARRLMEERDRGRRELVQRFFHRDVGDPHLYDMVINVGDLGPSMTAEMLVGAVKTWMQGKSRGWSDASLRSRAEAHVLSGRPPGR